MKILVTGAAGFIGAHLVRFLLGEGHHVTGLDVKSPASSPGGIRYEQCDITDRHRVTSVVVQANPDAIVHLAAQTGPMDDTRPNSYSANTVGVRNLVDAIREGGTVRRAVFTSSQLVCRVGYVPRSDTDFAPSTLYGESKIVTEKIVREQEGGGVEWCLVRPTTVWGPGMKPHYQRFLRMIEKGRYFHVGSRPLYKSWAYVGNIVYQYSRLMAVPAEKVHGKVFYLADYKPISLRSWTEAVQREFQSRPIPNCPEFVARLAARVGDVINLCGVESFPFNSFRLNNVLTEYLFDLGATEAVCGPLPYTVEEGVKETVRWLRSLEQN